MVPVRAMHVHLGRGVSFAIPIYIISLIRGKYPDPNGVYMGHKMLQAMKDLCLKSNNFTLLLLKHIICLFLTLDVVHLELLLFILPRSGCYFIVIGM